jgi:tetratricopeptide (TPR) repeat protein
LVFFFAGAGAIAAQDAEAVKQADDLDWNGNYKEERTALLSALARPGTPADQAEAYWRLARATLNIGDTDFTSGTITADQAIKLYEAGENYADLAIKLDASNPGGYFWKAANMGEWGQTRGILDSLFKAGPMRDNLRLALKYNPEMAEAFYVLGELYEKAPGWPLSFGNVEYSISLGRKSVALMEQQAASGQQPGRYDIDYISLAGHLWARNWDAARRTGEQPDMLRQFNERTDNMEKQFFYEGTVTLKNMSDRDEARAMLKDAIAELEADSRRTSGQEKDLRAARALFASFR